ncbi:HAD-IC family P-type ATPase [Candidatus Microgenomates bacterium]|nr:HAD-IC family P-type ATPase [Candidatus Microgenomates bacterium]
MPWYQKSARSVLEEFSVDASVGLTSEQVTENLRKFGLNVLATRKRETVIDIFIRQFRSPLIYILFLAAILVFSLGQRMDSLVILGVVTVNAFIGTFQEGRARDSLERLRDLTKRKALVRRNGEEMLVASEEVVSGDILVLREGDKIVADGRVITASSLTVDESTLTGEAYPVAKYQGELTGSELVVGDQRNMVFSGTSVSSGYGEAVVVATGLTSELGKISSGLAQTASVPLPLSRKINKLTHLLAGGVFGIGLVVFVLGVARGIPVREIFTAVVGLSVSIIPEGLPVVVTVVLAGGVWRMAKAKAVVRQMAAVEAMGNADVLLVDKTGTITTGEMVIREVHLDGTKFDVSGDGYDAKGEIGGGDKKDKAKLEKILALAYLSLKADVILEGSTWKPLGDSTEAAIAVLCKKAGLVKNQLARKYKTIDVRPFDSAKRYLMATFSEGKDTWFVYIGAPEFLASGLKIDHNLRGDYKCLAAQGKRVVGMAVYGPTKGELFAYALVAISEEVRPNVAQAISEAKSAGFKIAMMTGDYPETAKAIAQKVGIFETGDEVLAGADLESMSEKELRDCIGKVTVFARITPTHKLRIVNAFKQNGHTVAMTGDGVNDGPALQAANLGIGLGGGTQVAQDASDIVLLDDNFATIVGAINEGRGIYLTLKKVILYLFSTSLGEVFVITASILVGLPLPLVAVQIIWLNFVTDGFLDISLAQDPPEVEKLSRNNQNSSRLVDRLMIWRMVLVGVAMLLAALPAFVWVLRTADLDIARSMALLVLSVTQWFNALNVRSTRTSVFKLPVTNNKFLLVAFAIVFTLQIVAIQTPWGNGFLHTKPLPVTYWLVAFLISSLVVWVEEGRKILVRGRRA